MCCFEATFFVAANVLKPFKETKLQGGHTKFENSKTPKI